MEITKELQQIMDEYGWKSIDEIDWNYISYSEKLSEEFIEKYFNEFDLYLICLYQKLPEEFIEKYFDKFDSIDLSYIHKYQKLSEEFIEKYWDKLDLFYICQYQKLSEKFMEKYIDKLDKNLVCIFQDLSKNFAKEHKLDMKLYDKVRRKMSYHQKVEEVKKYCEKYNLKFDEKNKCFYAYRNHDKYGRGMFSNSIFYKKGIYYKDYHLDMRKNIENNFGLGIFPKGNIKVKVLIKDWGIEIDRDDGKCRVWGFEIV